MTELQYVEKDPPRKRQPLYKDTSNIFKSVYAIHF